MAVVTVGCKLPHGLVARVDSKTVLLRGANQAAVAGGHGITEGVDQAFWEAWLKRNQGAAYVRQGFVFAHARPESVVAQAVDNQSIDTGFEPLKPEGDARVGANAPLPAAEVARV